MAWDSNLVLANQATYTIDAQSTALDLNTSGYPGGVCQFRMIVESTIKVSDANETMLVYVEQSSDNTNWEKISCFPQLGTANHPNSTYTVKGGHVDCYAQVTKRYVRANIDVGGTNPSYASTTIRMRGLDAVGPA